MDLNQLEVFVAITKYKSFSKAAKDLFLTQPTVSAHLQNLESELDTVLINRNNKNITLTESGEIFYEHAINILNNCKKAVYDVKEYSGKIEGTIDMVCSSIPEAYVLPDFLKSFYNTHPNVQYFINHLDSKLAISEILMERFSFGIVGSKPNNAKIISHKLIKDELVLITPKSLILENENGFVDFSCLNNLTFIMREEGSGTRNLIENTLKDSSLDFSSLNTIAYLESNEAIKEMVSAGLACSIVSSLSVFEFAKYNELNIYKIKDLKFERHFHFIYSKKKVFNPLEKKFLSEMFSYFNLENN